MRSPTRTIVLGRNVVGLGENHDRLAVEARDAVQRLARRHDMDASRPARARYAADRRERPAQRRGRADARLRRRERRRRAAAARNNQMLPRTHGGRVGDAVRVHDGGDRHAIAARERLERFARRNDDRRAAFPGEGRRRRRCRNRAGDVAAARPIRAHAMTAAGRAVPANCQVRQRMAFDAVRCSGESSRSRRRAAGAVRTKEFGKAAGVAAATRQRPPPLTKWQPLAASRPNYATRTSLPARTQLHLRANKQRCGKQAFKYRMRKVRMS